MILLILACFLIGDAGAATVQTPKGPVSLAESSFDGAQWFCGTELAKALSGTLGTDKTYGRPVLQVPGHRVLLSTDTPLASVDGKIVRLSRQPAQRENCLWLPLDFLQVVSSWYGGRPADPAPKEPPGGTPPSPKAEAIRILVAPEGTRITLQGSGALEAKVGLNGRILEVRQPHGRLNFQPPHSAAGWVEKVDILEGGGRATIFLSHEGAKPEILRLKNPDRLVILLGDPPAPAPAPPPAPVPAQVPPAEAEKEAPAPPKPLTTPPAKTAALDVIVLDPGHGGTEVGAEGPGGLLEKDLTLALCKKAASSLEKAGFQVFLTREDDATVPLQSRAAIANGHMADVLISVHVNSSPSKKARGTETYYHSTEATNLWAKSLSDRENATAAASQPRDGLSLVLWDLAQTGFIRQSASFAEIIQAQFNDLLSTQDRGVHQAPFVVLQGAEMPAVLLEVAFLSNASEAKKLAEPEFQDQVAGCIAASVKAFKQVYEEPGAPVPPPAP